jgi:DNA polymerase III epsilon subunit-like protein
MVNNNVIIAFDFETGGLDIPTLEPLQVAGVALDPRTLQEVDHFASYMKPLDFNNLHPKAMAVNKIPLEKLREAPDQEAVWGSFAAWVKKHARKGVTGRPIPAGQGVKKFDMPIVERLCKTYGLTDKGGGQSLFLESPVLDLKEVVFLWFESSDELKNYSMDTFRDYFALPSEGGHDALVDSRQTAELLRRFMRLHRTLKAKKNGDGEPAIRFRGSCG